MWAFKCLYVYTNWRKRERKNWVLIWFKNYKVPLRREIICIIYEVKLQPFTVVVVKISREFIKNYARLKLGLSDSTKEERNQQIKCETVLWPIYWNFHMKDSHKYQRDVIYEIAFVGWVGRFQWMRLFSLHTYVYCCFLFFCFSHLFLFLSLFECWFLLLLFSYGSSDYLKFIGINSMSI